MKQYLMNQKKSIIFSENKNKKSIFFVKAQI